MTCCTMRNPQRKKKFNLMHTGPAGSLDFMAQSKSFLCPSLASISHQGPHFVVNQLLHCCILFIILFLFTQIHVLIITEARAPVLQFLLLCELKKNKDSIYNCFFHCLVD